MGTREVYEEKLRSGYLYYAPTMARGLGDPRCPHCYSLLKPKPGQGMWKITSDVHDASSLVGSVAGASIGFVHGFNRWSPFMQKEVKGPKWLPTPLLGSSIIQKKVKGPKLLQMLVGLPPLLLLSGAAGVFGGYALPAFAQLTETTYHVAFCASHYLISQPTRYIEDKFLRQSGQDGP